MISPKALLAILTLLLAVPFPAMAEEHTPDLHIHDAYARAGAAGSSGAVFFLIHNNTDADDRIVAVRTEVAKRAELHSHTMTADGVMQMREIEGGVPLPAGEMHAFARGGDHIMLLGMTVALQEGERFAVTLVLESGAEIRFDPVVDNARKPDAAGEGMEGHDHTKMNSGG